MVSGGNRIEATFAALKARDQAAFVAFVTAGDPDPETSLRIVRGLPGAGADIIELGMPFSDPMADGPAIQASSLRALKAGMTLNGTLDLLRRFREENTRTPVVLMGYYNPIHRYGVERFAADAGEAGADGLIIVDLPPEEDRILREAASDKGISLIRLATPTTDEHRLPVVLDGAGGFLYYVSITGVTGTTSVRPDGLEAPVRRLQAATDLPIAVGFGIRSPQDAAYVARLSDGAVVGSALVSLVAEAGGQADTRVLECAAELAGAIHAARREAGKVTGE
ncbi:MAG: tryptophan synthase subunit alpha [Alphaproteobacteria bacterium]